MRDKSSLQCSRNTSRISKWRSRQQNHALFLPSLVECISSLFFCLCAQLFGFSFFLFYVLSFCFAIVPFHSFERRCDDAFATGHCAEFIYFQTIQTTKRKCATFHMTRRDRRGNTPIKYRYAQRYMWISPLFFCLSAEQTKTWIAIETGYITSHLSQTTVCVCVCGHEVASIMRSCRLPLLLC